MAVIERSRRTVDVLCLGGCAERAILDALANDAGDREHVAELEAQRAMLEADNARARRARAAGREARAWR